MGYESPEAAYEAFFVHFNAEDRPGWAAVMNYPHVRVSAGTGSSAFYETPEDYASRVSWDRFKATGWVRTEGIEPARVFESPEKVIPAGGWTRYRADDTPIISNRVTYTLTQVSGGWGIQSRFGTDSFEEGEDTGPSERGALETVGAYLDARAGGDFSAAAGLAKYPLTDVGVGEVTQHEDAAAYEAALSSEGAIGEGSRELRAYQVGRTGVNVAIDAPASDGGRLKAVALVALVEEGWRIAGWSAIPR